MYKIRSERLLLIAATATLCAQEQCGALGASLGAHVTPCWPPAHVDGLSEIFAQLLIKRPEDVGFLGWYWCLVDDFNMTLVGFGGFKGQPDECGWLEIGYAVVDEFHGQGIATEAVGMLVRWCMQFDDVLGVRAHVRPDNMPSRRVLERNRFIFAHMVPAEDDEDESQMLYLRSFLSA